VALWYWQIADKLEKTTDYGVEKHFYPDKFKKRTDGGTGHTSKFNKYKNGKHEPEPEQIQKAEIDAPGSETLLEHSFWAVIHMPVISKEDIYLQLIKLKPSIVDFLFTSYRPAGQVPTRRENPLFEDIDRLYKESDWDALTACLGIVQESRITNRFNALPFFEHNYLKLAINLFCKLICQRPFFIIKDELLEYLHEHFFDKCTDATWVAYYKDFNIEIKIQRYQYIVYLIEHLKIFKQHDHIPTACLYFTDKYLTKSVFLEIHLYEDTGQHKKISQIPEIKNMTRSLRRWEKKVLATNGSPLTL